MEAAHSIIVDAYSAADTVQRGKMHVDFLYAGMYR